MKTLIDIPEELNHQLKVDRTKKMLKNKEEMILFILELILTVKHDITLTQETIDLKTLSYGDLKQV